MRPKRRYIVLLIMNNHFVLKNFLSLTGIICMIMLNHTVSSDHTAAVKPMPGKIKAYSGLIFEQTQILRSSFGVKSIFFNSSGTNLYALNLEAMSIYEFSQARKKIIREIVFSPTKAKGIDYLLRKPLSSFEEKPVEACFSHHDKILWVSLHNAGGVVPIFLDSLLPGKSHNFLTMNKQAYVTDFETKITDTVNVPLVRTGKTPKVIAKTADDNYLLVSNWSSKTVSVLKINDTLPPYGKKITTIATAATPRGITVIDKNHKSYIAIMGSNTIAVINNKRWKIEKSFVVPLNPRHLIADTAGYLFASFNALSKIACIEAKTGKVLFTARTQQQPRTIALSKNQKFLFVACYGGNSVDVFKINPQSFSKIYSLKCTGKPVGIAIYEDDNKLEAWTCNYMAGNLKVFTFRKSP